MTGGVADRSGLINIGDEIIEVNNINVTEKTPNDILNILVSTFPAPKKIYSKSYNIDLKIGNCYIFG